MVDSARGGRMRSFSLWALLPLSYSFIMVVGLWLVYSIAVRDERIAPLSSDSWKQKQSFYPPYISFAGNYPQASCIFSEVMNLSGFLGFFIAVLRYLQLKNRLDKPWLNILCLVIFSVGCFAMTLVGNFQLLPERIIHNVGAFVSFGLGTLFCWLQSYITLRVNFKNEGRWVGILRFLLSGFITVCIILYFSLMYQRLHMHAARSQWALVMLFVSFIGTFAIEFRHDHFHIVCVDNPGRPVSPPEALYEESKYQTDQL